MNFNKSDLMDALHERVFNSWMITLNVENYVPANYIAEVDKHIFKYLKKQWKQVDKEDKKYQKSLKPPAWYKRLFWKIFKRKKKSVEEPGLMNVVKDQSEASKSLSCAADQVISPAPAETTERDGMSDQAAPPQE